MKVLLAVRYFGFYFWLHYFNIKRRQQSRKVFAVALLFFYKEKNLKKLALTY